MLVKVFSINAEIACYAQLLFHSLKNIIHPSFVSTNRDIQSGVLF